jgi:hypothetical protein
MLFTRSSDKATHQPTSIEGALFHSPGCNPGYTRCLMTDSNGRAGAPWNRTPLGCRCCCRL